MDGKSVVVKLGVVISTFLFLLHIAAGLNVPYGPNVMNVTDQGGYVDSTEGRQVNAKAGNVTEVNIFDERSTWNWAGFYGNVSGLITLDDGNNNTMYDWPVIHPTGEVYASNGSTVTWADIACIQLTEDTSAAGARTPFNASSIEQDFHINTTTVDGLDETFNWTYANTTGFWVGAVHINNNDTCAMTHTYINDAPQAGSSSVHDSARYQEVLLTDNISIIFTTLLEDNEDGFRTGVDKHDFQMIVLEDGTYGYEDTTTPYYFYVELE